MATVSKTENGTGELQDDFAALRKDFAMLTEHVKALADTAAGDAKHGLAERGAKLRDAATAAAATAKQRGEAGVAALEGQIQTHPFAALAIAFGVGVVVSKLMSRDR